MTTLPRFVERPCRACRGPLDLVLDLGKLRVSNFPTPSEEPTEGVPLTLSKCNLCGLLQLTHTVDPTILYRHHYWYRSGINETMRAELRNIVQAARLRVPIGPEDTVVDIGANDGTLLDGYRAEGCHADRIAFEPAMNLQAALREHAEFVVADLFPGTLNFGAAGLFGKAKVITSIAMVYDIDDLPAFFTAIRSVLHRDGIWIVQFQDLAQMLRATAFDNICHEHLTYFSLRSFEDLANSFGLVLVDAERRAINGGSLRLYLQHHDQTRSIDPEAEARISELYAAEVGCDDWLNLEAFAWKVGEVRRLIHGIFDGFWDRERSVDLYAASTKANTLLQYCGLGYEQIRWAWERSEEKYGRQTITGIPIIPEAEGRADPPDVLMLGAWQFKDAFIEREAKFLAHGGGMLVPLPHPEIVGQLRGKVAYGTAG